MAHQTEIVVNGVVTEVTEFDHTAQEIDDSVDRAMLSLLAVAAAVAYNPSGTYVIGDYCTNDGNLYKCNTPIESGEAWNAAHWTATTVVSELADVRASLSNKVMQIGSVTQSQVDKLTYDRTMVASFQPHITGLPKSGYGIITLYSYEDFTKQNGAQEVFYTDGERYWRKAVNDSVSPWYRVATGTPPQEYNLPLVDGISGTAKYSKDQFGIVRVYMAAVKDSGTITNNEILGTLPEGFRPKTSFAVVGYGNSNPNSISDRHPVNMYISSNGDITASFLSETDAMKIASLYGTTEFLSES